MTIDSQYQPDDVAVVTTQSYPFTFEHIGPPTIVVQEVDSSLDVINALRYAETFGKVNLSSSMDVTVLVDFLVKNVDAKILNQPTLWAKDNEEATFFRGRTIPFIASSQSSVVIGTRLAHKSNSGSLRIASAISGGYMLTSCARPM